MKKIAMLSVLVVILFGFVGCASTSSSISANDWWNNPPADTADYHYEVGMAKGSTAQTSRDWAKANANQALAQYVSNSVDTIVATYVNDAGEQSKNNTQAVQAFESLSKQRAQAVLSGVTYKYQTEPDGTVYVLAALPIGPVAEELKETVRESFIKNEAAAEANEMMNAAIDKYFGAGV